MFEMAVALMMVGGLAGILAGLFGVGGGMVLASKRWLHKIDPVELKILTGARNLGSLNVSPRYLKIGRAQS